MVEDQNEGSLSNTTTNSRFDDQSFGKDNALKARKPYTITKQREKWTQDEHVKFLDALKLHGRSWPKIVERVGSKTAVQIRSHAQKFFSKVVRESTGSDGTEAGSIEIPPPRAKRKPTRPYPRKVSPPLKKQADPVSVDSSGSNHENTSSSSLECVSIQSLKLFGKTFFVTGSRRPSSVDTNNTRVELDA
ncbi:hypothetical protein SSX86_010078 [Deinandra increscens subsp. villosa]|uniref:Uncharacterized protein n=1 Tax=Deinandra increscens subsp. villosa TaxID=3103831 RepID=A0AAP0DAT3_9ASTR